MKINSYLNIYIMNKYILDFKLFEKLMLKNWDNYAKIISDKYDAMMDYNESKVHHWKALNESNYKLWRRLISKANVIFVSSDESKADETITILDKDYTLLYNPNQPYKDQKEMKADYATNNRLYISIDHSEHPYFSVVDNIVFRTVHDFIVHILGDYPFGLKGEIQCYNLHAKLATKEAVPALYTEIVGQVCQVIVKGDFPKQKVDTMEGVDYYNVGNIKF